MHNPGPTQKPEQALLVGGPTVDSHNPAIQRAVAPVLEAHEEENERAIALYYLVRDQIRYDPYRIELSVEGLRASQTLAIGRGWCVSKAILLAAMCRAAGIPARLGFADVRNHLSTERLRKAMQTDVFYWHGYTSIWLNHRWLKVTPAFNLELCQRFDLAPLDWDGLGDCLYQAYDLHGSQHMEYLHYRGEIAEPPIAEIQATFAKHYSRVEPSDHSPPHFEDDLDTTN